MYIQFATSSSTAMSAAAAVDPPSESNRAVTKRELEAFAENTFAGWCYPHAPKTAGAMVMVLPSKTGAAKEYPYVQVSAAIKKHKARNVLKSALYQTLLQCAEKVALVQPLNLAVSGVNEPGLYCVENYVAPTALYYDIGTTVFHNLLTRIRPRRIKKSTGDGADLCATFEHLEAAITSLGEDDVQRSLGSLLYTESILHSSIADAGLRFKDRSSTKMTVAKRNKDLWELARQLDAFKLLATPR